MNDKMNRIAKIGWKLFNFLNRYRKRLESTDTEFKYFLTQKIVTKALTNMGLARDLGSGKNLSRILGSKKHRAPDPGSGTLASTINISP
jgi:hypothetical protein